MTGPLLGHIFDVTFHFSPPLEISGQFLGCSHFLGHNLTTQHASGCLRPQVPLPGSGLWWWPPGVLLSHRTVSAYCSRGFVFLFPFSARNGQTVGVVSFLLVSLYWARSQAKQKYPLYVNICIFVCRHWSPEFDCFCCPANYG